MVKVGKPTTIPKFHKTCLLIINTVRIIFSNSDTKEGITTLKTIAQPDLVLFDERENLFIGDGVHVADDDELLVGLDNPGEELTEEGKRRIGDDQGKKYIRVKGVRWFTNLDHGRRHQPLQLMTMADNLKFSRHKEIKGKNSYIHYENYDAIEVPYTDAIPSDYDGKMGVPISFLDKYCPEQFEIIGQTQGDSGKELGLKPFPRELKKLNPSLRDGQLYYFDKDGLPQKPYARILIRKKH